MNHRLERSSLAMSTAARSATLNVGAGAAGKGIIIARDLLSISGPGASTIKSRSG